MIITVTMNPAIDKTASLHKIEIGSLNRMQHVINDVGGKGINVSKVVQVLGGKTICTGFIAGSNGDWIIQQLDILGLKHDFVKVSGNTRINTKLLDDNMILTEINEPGTILDNSEAIVLLDKVMNLVHINDIVVLSGSVPEGINTDIYATYIKKIKQNNLRVILDADGILFKEAIEMGPYCIKPNKYELCKYLGIDEDCSEEKLITNAKKLLNKGIHLIVVSLGSKGAIFITKNQTIISRGLDIKPHSAVGAGDSMVGALAYGIEQELSLVEIVKYAMASSAGAVVTTGTKAPDIEIIDLLMKQVIIETK